MMNFFGRSAFLVLVALIALMAFGCAAVQTTPTTQALTPLQQALNTDQSQLNAAQFALTGQEIIAAFIVTNPAQTAALQAFDTVAQNAINQVQADINNQDAPTAAQDLQILATAISNYRVAVSGAKATAALRVPTSMLNVPATLAMTAGAKKTNP